MTAASVVWGRGDSKLRDSVCDGRMSMDVQEGRKKLVKVEIGNKQVL